MILVLFSDNGSDVLCNDPKVEKMNSQFTWRNHTYPKIMKPTLLVKPPSAKKVQDDQISEELVSLDLYDVILSMWC